MVIREQVSQMFYGVIEIVETLTHIPRAGRLAASENEDEKRHGGHALEVRQAYTQLAIDAVKSVKRRLTSR